MEFYMAPMEGVTSYIFRNAHYDHFKPADKYFTPFITPGLNSSRRSKALKDVLPENNHGPNIVPQILTNRADEFIYTENQLKEMGYTEINLNLGCPSGTVVSKGRGSGFLAFPDELDAFLDEIYSHTSMKISIKTRLGRESADEFAHLLEIYNQYPLEELIIHPRTREDYYRGIPNMDAFQMGIEKSKCPVCFNGNIFTRKEYRDFRNRFPDTDRVMVGRGIVANPALLEILTDEKAVVSKERIRAFYERIYADYRENIQGDINQLYKMKELWNYLICIFSDSKKYKKKIRKAQRLNDYQKIVDQLFEEQDILQDAGFQPD